jgi:hypothetical protein
MLDDTLIVWAGEFGRTVYSQGMLTETNYGRDHHPRCFTVWLAGGGIKPGISYGQTDDYSYNIIQDPLEVHDLHATMLHLLGMDHTKLSYRHQGRDFRLTDVFGKVNRRSWRERPIFLHRAAALACQLHVRDWSPGPWAIPIR